MKSECCSKLEKQGFTTILTECYLHLRYEGTDCALMVGPGGDYQKTFLERYQTEFGFTIPSRTIVVDDIRVRGIGKILTGEEEDLVDTGEDGQPEKVNFILPKNFFLGP